MRLCGFDVGPSSPFFLIAGPCVIESEKLTLDIANELKSIGRELDIPVIFKASYDKANRSSGESYRGTGLTAGLEILSKVKDSTGLPVLTDVHSIDEIKAVSNVVDV